jgi:hypothetical protein
MWDRLHGFGHVVPPEEERSADLATHQPAHLSYTKLEAVSPGLQHHERVADGGVRRQVGERRVPRVTGVMLFLSPNVDRVAELPGCANEGG